MKLFTRSKRGLCPLKCFPTEKEQEEKEHKEKEQREEAQREKV